MKKLFTLFFTLIIVGSASAQIFWTENFGTNCLPRANVANGYTGVNGTWTVTSTGTNESFGNEFYINDRIAYNGNGNCATGSDLACSPTPNNSLHIGGKDILGIFPADSSSFWTGFFGQASTNLRAESPAINCTGKTNITVTFVYYEGGDHANGDPDGDATMMYYDGSTWTKISDFVKLPDFTSGNPRPVCSGTMYGQFGAFSIVLPVSANNNANVKIGFNWTNNNSGSATDPSFAVDSIQVSGTGSVGLPPVAAITALGSDSSCAPLCKQFSDNSTGSPTSWLWTFSGPTPSSSTAQNPGLVCWDTAGTYSVKLKVSNANGSDSVTFSNKYKVIGAPPTPSISQSHDTLFCTINAAYSGYQWYEGNVLINGETNYYYKVPHNGSFNVSVRNSAGCEVAVGTTVTNIGVGLATYNSNNEISLFPSPAKNDLSITGNWQSSTGTLSIYDILGKKVKEESVRLDKRLVYDIKNLSQGVYFLHIDNDKGRWTGKFIKE